MSALVVDLLQPSFISGCVQAAKADACQTCVQMNHSQAKKIADQQVKFPYGV